MQQAMELLKSGDLKEALRLFEVGEHWYEAGKVAQRLKKNSKAVDYFVRAKRFSDAANVHLSDGDFEMAAKLFEQGNAWHEAAAALEQWISKKHGITRANVVAKGVGRDLRNAVKDLTTYFTKAGQHDQAAPWYYAAGDKLKAAECFVKGGAFGRAAVIFEEHKKDLEAGQAWSKAGEHLKAAEAFKRCDMLMEAGQAFEQAGSTDAAITCYRRAKRLDLAGELCLKLNRGDQAAALFEEGKHFFEAAQCHRRAGDNEKVIAAIQQLPKKDANYNKACLLLIDACIKKNEVNFQSDDYLKEFLRLPFTAKTLKLFFDLGQLYEKLEFYESAQEIYKKIAAVDAAYAGLPERLEFVHLQITGTPLAVKQILEDDFGYKQTSERLASLQGRNRPGQVPVPDMAPAAPAPAGSPHAAIAAADPLSTSNFSNRAVAAPTDAPSLKIEPGALLAGRYRLFEPLPEAAGRGGAWRAKDQQMDDEVALRIFDSAAMAHVDLDAFKQAIKQARKLNHPALATILDYGSADGCHFMTCELVPAPSLKERMRKNGRLSLEEALPLLIAVSELLQSLHKAAIVHRDLRPSTLRLANDNAVKLLEFGLPSHEDLSRGELSGDAPSHIERLSYMSPEQLRGQNLDARADLYALGVLMYEIFTEQIPFDSKEAKGLIYQQLHDTPTTPSTINPGIPPALEALMLRCMAKDANARPASAEEVTAALRQIGQECGVLKETAPAVAGARPRIINERYEIKSELGRGGMGVVYRAHDVTLQRDVALKFLPHELGAKPEDLELFLNEARSAARLSHTNIVAIHNIEKLDKEHFIVMEFIDGVDLRNLIDTMEKLPFKSIELICRQICEALEYAHKRKVFHRDIKCANILWTNDKIVKITDFGLAKIAEGALAASTRVQGSPAYMSPEQILGKSVDHRTDIYSLGVALYEMTVGHVPFSKGDIAYHQLHTEPPPVEQLRADTPEHLRAIIHRCMRKDPNERFQSAAEIIGLLAKVS